MTITQFRIENFKCFRKVSFALNRDLNVFTGVNNSGKTTVLEAIALWAECFTKLTQQIKKNDPKQGLIAGQYRLGSSQAQYEDCSTITSVRSPDFADIFHQLDRNSKIIITARVENLGASLDIAFTITGARGWNYDLRLHDYKNFDTAKFNQIFSAFPRPIGLMYASPIAAILPEEEFKTRPKIHALVGSRQSTQVLRNRLYQLKKQPERWQSMCNDVSYILTDNQQPFAVDFYGDETKDVELWAYAKVGPRDIAKNVSLLGSGTLQVIELLLAIYNEPKDLNIVLLDEPDSHIHRDIQRRLINVLQREKNFQVFVSTHNESLIRSIAPQYLFHLDQNAERHYTPICDTHAAEVQRGLQPSPYSKVLTTLGSETALDFLNALEADKLVLVEGADDARHIQAIREIHGPRQPPFRAMYWAFGGVDEIFRRISAYKTMFGLIRNQNSLWDKAVLVFDRDTLTHEHRAQILTVLKDKLNIPVIVWESYTLEATLLSETGTLKQLVVDTIRKTQPGVDPVRVESAIDRALVKQATEIRSRLSDDRVFAETGRRLVARFGHLQEQKLAPKKFSGDALTARDQYKEYVEDCLARGLIDRLATKHEVAAVVEQAYAEAACRFDPNTWFEQLVRASTPSTYFQQWRALVAAL